MASGPEKASCVLAFHGTTSVVTVQREFRQKDGKIPSSKPSAGAWYDAQRGMCSN